MLYIRKTYPKGKFDTAKIVGIHNPMKKSDDQLNLKLVIKNHQKGTELILG